MDIREETLSSPWPDWIALIGDEYGVSEGKSRAVVNRGLSGSGRAGCDEGETVETVGGSSEGEAPT